MQLVNKPVTITFEEEEKSMSEINFNMMNKIMDEFIKEINIPKHLFESTPPISSFFYQIQSEQRDISFHRP